MQEIDSGFTLTKPVRYGKYWSDFPSDEHWKLETLELRSGHVWERTSSGLIKYYGMGPVCEPCGFALSVEFGIPEATPRCVGRFND